MWIGGFLLAAVAAGLGYRRLLQRRVTRALRTGFVERRYVRLGGVDQWIQVRGTDRSNPILLYLAGSGLPMEPFTAALAPWERHFTVVFWDRRDVGRTRGRNGTAGGDGWTFDLLAEDGIALVEHLRAHLGQDRVVVLGHSQGSLVAIRMVRRRPDLFHAYVGTGQITDMARNEERTHRMALERARTTDRRAARALERTPPPFRTAKAWITKQRWSMATDPESRRWRRVAGPALLTWPGYGPGDLYRALLGVMFMPPRLFEETMACTPERLGTDFAVPVYLLHGADDVHTLPDLAAEYLEAISAPAKAFVPIEGAGHLAPFTQSERFLAALTAHVR